MMPTRTAITMPQVMRSDGKIRAIWVASGTGAVWGTEPSRKALVYTNPINSVAT